jgi:hypothetical protein
MQAGDWIDFEPRLVEASLDRKPSNANSPFTRRGERGWGRAGETSQFTKMQNLL